MNTENDIFEMKLLPTFLQFHRSIVTSEIDILKEFIIDVNNFVEREKREFEKRINEMVKKSPNDSQDIYDHFSDQYGVYDSKYIELANNGSLTTAFSFFEYQMRDILRVLNNFMVNKKGNYTTRKNLSYVENLRNEIFTITGLNFTSLDALWTDLDKFRKVRNVIVHNGSNLREDTSKVLSDQKNYTTITSFNAIRVNQDNGDFYIADRAMVIEYLDQVEEYLVGLMNILNSLDRNDIR